MQMRARALERRRLPDELDRMLTVASSPAWLAVAALAMALIGLVVWAFAGSLPRQVEAQGVLNAGSPSPVQSTVTGQVERVNIHAGQTVLEGQSVLSVRGTLEQRVVSRFRGRVASVEVAPGQFVRPGTPLYTLVPERRGDVDALVFLSGDDGATVTRGMKVNLQVASAPASAFGVARGRVVDVSTSPASHAALNALLGNPDLAGTFERNGPPVVARVRLERDAGTRSGLRWSTKDGPPFKLQPGVSVKAQIIQASERPADVLFGT
jgi:multidrug efflux pump subunit AcrA (membrane-fusion protein)